MRALLLLLLLFAVGAASAYYLRADNGYVLVSYGQWMLETSVVGFLAALAALIVVVLVVLRLLGAGLRLPKSVRDALARQRPVAAGIAPSAPRLSLIHISEPTRPY